METTHEYFIFNNSNNGDFCFHQSHSQTHSPVAIKGVGLFFVHWVCKMNDINNLTFGCVDSKPHTITTDVENQISILKSLQKEIEDTKEHLKYLRENKKSRLIMVRDAIQEHLESLPVKEGREWLNSFYWSDRVFAHAAKEAYRKVFGSGFIPPIKRMKIECQECGKIEDVPCKTWHDYKQKSSRGWSRPLCKSCQAIKDEQDESQRIINKKLGEERQEYVENLMDMPYAEYLQTEHWQEIRKDTLRNAGYRCQLCNEKGTLDVHHRTYNRLGWERPTDVIALCRDCHEKHHDIDNE